MKRLSIFGLMAAILSVAIFACKDDFNEEDFLRLQSDLKLKQDTIVRARQQQLIDSTSEQAVKEYISATNEAGDLLGLTLMLRENGTPVQGVTVSLTTSTPNQISNGRTKQVQTLVTDASGNVVFDRVTIGSGTISFSKQGYVSATATVDFGQPSGPSQIQVQTANGTVTRYIPPTKKFEEAIVPMFSTTPSAGSTATIRGRFTYENDVTNLTPEVPVNAVLRANLTTLVASSQAFMQSFVLEDDSDLGRATVNANGEYSMTVPASATSSTITLILPNIIGTRRTAVNGYDNGTGTAVSLPNGPEYRDVPVIWGQQATGVSTTIPTVVGAKVVFPAPPPAGSGLAFDFTPVPRSLPAFAVISTSQQNNSGLITKILNRGSYGSSAVRPTVTITGGGGSLATAVAILQTRVTQLNVVNSGSGYVGGIDLTIRATRQNGTTVDLSTFSYPAVNGGLPAVLDLDQIDGTNNGFGIDESVIALDGGTADTYVSLSLAVENAPLGGTTASVNATFATDLNSLVILNGGQGYTSSPTFTFSGGAAGVSHAQVIAEGLEVYWNVAPNNNVSANYAVVPDDFTIVFPTTSTSSETTGSIVDTYEMSNGTVIDANADIETLLTVENGHVVLANPTRGLRTNSQWSVMPQMLIVQVPPKIAKAVFAISDINSSTGEINSVFATPAPADRGNGYSSPITATVQPTIQGAPGSGATLRLPNTFNSASKEYSWSGLATLLTRGSDYLPNLNRKGEEVPFFLSPFNVSNIQAGKTYTVNINYGTGSNQVHIN